MASKATEYIPQMCEILKREYPYFSNKDIQYRILADATTFPKLITNNQ